MGLFDRKKYIENADFICVIGNLARQFESLRENFIFGSLSQLKCEGFDVSGISRDIVPGSELDDILKGFQLTAMMGIAWKYIKDKDRLAFDRLLSSTMKAEMGSSRAWNYRDRYLDCRGDMDALAKALSVDVHRAIGFPEPRVEFLIQFQAGAELLVVLCQLATYTACGDEKMSRKLKKRIGMPQEGF